MCCVLALVLPHCQILAVVHSLLHYGITKQKNRPVRFKMETLTAQDVAGRVPRAPWQAWGARSKLL